ncbi:MAG TPA: DHH family phosphoesterase, partial [Bacteroidales bacterium]|nr:DHH family phosphoesterase [Bacteroidales bacterium]
MEYSITEKLIRKSKADIEASDSITIVMHHNPDGDALGASLGMYLLLKKLGKKVQVIAPSPYPDFLSWMKGHGDVIIGSRDKAQTLKALQNTELLILLDFNVLNRTDWMEPEIRKLSCRSLLIDHHPNPGNFADTIISSTEPSSTSELVYQFIHKSGWSEMLDKDMGECLYAGIMTDTGGFSHNSSRPETFETVASLLKAGIDKDKVFARVYNNYSFDRMRFLGHA